MDDRELKSQASDVFAAIVAVATETKLDKKKLNNIVKSWLSSMLPAPSGGVIAF
jgi:hypothetical protein